MSFDYFYGQQSDLFTFYRVPKVLFTNERFWNISADAKMLYGILLDRMSLSAKNGWIDKNGRVYIIFTIDEAKMALNCAEQKAIKLLSELEKKAGLIERKRQGLGKPNLIYVKNFMLVNYSEEFDDISPALLAKSFQKNAEMISEYRVLSSAGEGIDYQGKVLLNSRAVRLLSYVEDMSGDEKVRTIQSKELWLAEDMTFYVVSCMSTITMDKEEAICLNEHRSVVTTVECEDDIFFDMGSLICELDDICLFELLADVDATIYEL